MISFDVRNFDVVVISTYIELFMALMHCRISKKPNFGSEKFFWARYFNERKKRYGDVKKPFSATEENTQSTKIVLETMANLRKTFPNKLSLIDVGAGPFSVFNIDYLLTCQDLEIVTLDPLATFYNKLHERFQTNYKLEITEGSGEDLVKQFGKNRFHLAFTENALDHSANPLAFAKNLLDIVMPGGYLIVIGYLNNGTLEKWQGLHKWDVGIDNGELIVSNQNKTICDRLFSDPNVAPKSNFTLKGEKGKEGAEIYYFVYAKS
jgi:SAM-dependent methyltransferase